MSAPGRVATTTSSEDETLELAARFASSLPAGAVVLLLGDLGAGKTAFVRGMAIGLGIDAAEVSSPTFTLIQEYRRPEAAAGPAPARADGRTTLYHVDLYRLEPGETDDLGLEELSSTGGIVAIEWAEKLARRPAGAITVAIADEGEDRRRIEIVEE